VRVSDDGLSLLEWERIRSAWADGCVTSLGRDATAVAGFLPDSSAVLRVYGLLGELMRLEAHGVRFSLGAVFDVKSAVNLAERGGVVDVLPLWEMAQTLASLRRVRRQCCGFGEENPSMLELAASIPDLDLLATELSDTFDPSGEIRDDASPELRSARRRLANLTKRTKERLDQFLRSANIVEQVQDDYYTQREGRFVLPVIASFQQNVTGIIHGTSNTGQTVYIEPESFIEANNQLALTHAEVRQAMRQVLVDRSQWIAEEAVPIRAALSSLVELDQLQARVRLALRMRGSIPKLSDAGVVRLRAARNPALVLQGVDVVANDIELAQNQSFVVVTGPNTGGKTVTLTTLGSLAVMLAAGLPVPADPDSELPFFESIHALGGDQQDIDRNLSTFSGHMLALKGILEDAGANSLVLLDEIAVGTEPAQGAALAVAVLESLVEHGARGFVTTHYERLKLLAYQSDAFANACVGVQGDTGRPTYRLTFGESGISNPFDVVERLGFAPHVVGRARAILSGNEDVENALDGLRTAQRLLLEKMEAAEAERSRLETQAREMARERARLKVRAQESVREMTFEARTAIEEALTQVREQVRGLQDVGDAKELQRRRTKLLEAQANVTDLADEKKEEPLASAPSRPSSSIAFDLLRSGHPVFVHSLEREGVVVEARSEAEVVVSVGPLKLTVALRDLGPSQIKDSGPKYASKKKPKKKRAERSETPDYESPPPRTDSITCDLRGMRRDEVADIVNHALDRAYLNHWEALWIIHGHGTGALRDEVRSILKLSPYLRYSRAGLAHEGGNGVTIVWLDNR
jgi:DNA mismatch repair protein MutS2